MRALWRSDKCKQRENVKTAAITCMFVFVFKWIVLAAYRRSTRKKKTPTKYSADELISLSLLAKQ